MDHLPFDYKINKVGHAQAEACSSKLIVIAPALPYMSTHFFTELLGYRAAAQELGLSIKILVPRGTSPRILAVIGAVPSLEQLPRYEFGADDRELLPTLLHDFLDAERLLQPVWSSIDNENLEQVRAVVCTFAHPALIRSAGLWLQDRSADHRPPIFFRFTADASASAQAFFLRLASEDLMTRLGEDGVFFLGDSEELVRRLKRVVRRHTSVLSIPKYFGDPPASKQKPIAGRAYVHVNFRCRQLAHRTNEIMRMTKRAIPAASFLIKFTGNAPAAGAAALTNGRPLASAEVAPADQAQEEYFSNLTNSSVVVLPYDDIDPQRPSGVFVEAAGLGRPVVVPAGTWMAQEIAAKHAAGVTFDQLTPESVAAALVEALRNVDELSVTAEALAPLLKTKHSTTHVLQSLLALASRSQDTTLRYRLGEEINFGDPYDSRCFMLGGWSITERWGTWTHGHRAELSLRLEADTPERLILSAEIRPFLASAHTRLGVAVTCCGRLAANWKFEAPAKVEWRSAVLPSHANEPLKIAFDIDSPRSPHELGVGEDRRPLGLGFIKMMMSAG
jgi:hypothetical protein